jgi:hypothetical protein
VFWGYIDDSGDKTTGLRTLSCFIGHWSVLFDFEVAWNRVIEKANRRLAAAGRRTISRFHATDWSTKRKEFSGWSDDEKFELFDNLLALFERYNVVGCGESVYLTDVATVFPEAAAQDKVDHLAHTLLFSMIVLYIDQNLLSRFPTYETDRIAFVHDSEQFNGVPIDTLKELKTDPAVKCRDRLVGIELKSWQEETLLQPADLIAYENFKVAERKHAGAEMRLTMKKILDTEFRGRNAWLQKDPLQKWRDKANKETLNRLFVPARMKPLS